MRRKTKPASADGLDAAIARTAGSLDTYTRLYPDLLPRLREILESGDPRLRHMTGTLRDAVKRARDGGQANLTRRYGLTPAQARIAVFIGEGGTVAEYAKANRISPATVRTHLKAIFAKTGVSRQAELAHMLVEIGRSTKP